MKVKDLINVLSKQDGDNKITIRLVGFKRNDYDLDYPINTVYDLNGAFILEIADLDGVTV